MIFYDLDAAKLRHTINASGHTEWKNGMKDLTK